MPTSAITRFAVLFVALASLLAPARAAAAEILLVCDTTSDTEIATILRGDGHSVTVVMNDFATGNTALRGDLTIYDVVYWSANGSGYGDVHSNPAVFTNLTTYVMNGGRVFVTGYDSVASPLDAPLLAFVGGTGSIDGASPGAIVMVDNALTTGVVDIRGATPTGGYGDQDTVTGILSDTVVISPYSGGGCWTLRTVGVGLIAYVSNGAPSGGTTPSWTTTTGTIGARAYNAVVRNFAFSATGAGGPCTGEDTACMATSGRMGICHMDRCCTGCWDGTRCYSGTTGTACGVMGGACISCADADPCSSDVCTAGVCSNPTAPAGTACEDGMFCTAGDRCDAAGTCVSGAPNSCDDGSACSADSCDEDMDVCNHVPGGSGCFVAGVCAMSFTLNPANPCQICDPARSTTAWSPRTVGIACGTATCSGVPAMLTGGGACDATGTCAPAGPMPCPQGRCASSSSCASSCAPGSCPPGLTCNASSMRCVPAAAIGARCVAGGDCMSGFCADGVCCMSACDGLCDSCDLAGSVGTCLPSPEGRSCGLPICIGGSVTNPGTCDASGSCMRIAPVRCPSGLCLDPTTCNPDCSPASCAIGEICTVARRCVVPAANGEPCGADDECVSGQCTDGVCCQTVCNDTCVSCDQPGREGLCTPYTASTDPELECPIGSVCGGGRACAPGMIDAGPPDTGPAEDAGVVRPDTAGGLDAGDGAAPMRRGCSCAAAGLPQPRAELGLGVVLAALGLLLARRRS